MTTIIRMYKAGDPSVLVAEEVKLHHKAIGVNFVDTMFRSGAFAAPLPFVTGVEAAGIVTEALIGHLSTCISSIKALLSHINSRDESMRRILWSEGGAAGGSPGR
jgi:hypothetical protein